MGSEAGAEQERLRAQPDTQYALINTGRAYADVQRLAFPRRTGSADCSCAAGIVRERLRAAGLEPVTEPFTFSPALLGRAFPALVLSAAGVVLASTALYRRTPRLSAATLALGFAAGLPATRWSRRVESLLDGRPQVAAENVVARLCDPPAPARHVILMAHYDSKSQRFPMPLRMAAAAAAGAGGGLLFAGAVGAASGIARLPARLVQAAGLVGAAGLASLASNTSGNRSPGALDNASGVALLLELARTLPALSLQRTRVTLVATGAEEEGLAGSVRFFQAHADDLGPNPCLINLDSVGAAGRVAVLSAFGIPPMGRAPVLVALAQEVAGELGIPLAAPFLPPGVGTDHFPAALRRIPAVTLSCLGPGLRRIHTPADCPALVTPEGLEEAGRLVLGMLARLDERVAK